MIALKRAYEQPSEDDGLRVLVERLWPRGLTKQKARIDVWLKDVAPSTELRQWFGHEVSRWEEFQRRYRAELQGKGELIDMLRKKGKAGPVTLVYAARDEQHNGALVLKDVLLHRAKRKAARRAPTHPTAARSPKQPRQAPLERANRRQDSGRKPSPTRRQAASKR